MTPRTHLRSVLPAPLPQALAQVAPTWAAAHGTDGRQQSRVLRLLSADGPWAQGAMGVRTVAGAHVDVPPVSVAQALPPADWNALLAAVVHRLRGTAALPGAAPAQMRAPLLDCAHSLELLQAALSVERKRGQSAMHALAHARADLAATQHELLDTREGERRARHQAHHDSLTALPNRRSFSERLVADLQAAAGQVQPLAVLFLDLDGFKAINDRHGHQTGDRLLCVVADRLRRAVRAGDMVCRLGGDEFACLLQAPIGRPQLVQVAAKLFDTISAPVRMGALQLEVRPSIGIAVCPEHGHTAAGLLHHADAAMYRAKRAQSGYAFFDDGDATGSAGAAGG